MRTRRSVSNWLYDGLAETGTIDDCIIEPSLDNCMQIFALNALHLLHPWHLDLPEN